MSADTVDANAAPPILEVRRLDKRFAGREGAEAPWVLRGLSFSVAEGEFLTMVGPSGSGKSTLLNIIAQVDRPTGGAVLFRGEVVSSPETRELVAGMKRQIGYVTQDDNLLPWRTMLENVLFPLKVQGRLDEAGRERAAKLVAAVGLSGYERYYPHELSGGMRKRASLIRTLVYDPPVILMDEPFGALDAQTRTQLHADLLALWSLGRKTVIFVTHDIGEAITLGDRTVVLSRAPTCVAGEHAVDLPRPRDVNALLAEPAFARLHEAIRAQIR